MAPESTPVDIVCEVCQVCCYFVYLPFSSISWVDPEGDGTGGPDPSPKCYRNFLSSGLGPHPP